ncbi:MAG: hypothetical protein GTO23_06285 [Nitrososphaeria archaeon]|nr:hypothetical protein [Nitrososphaeria archaeon]
MSGESKAPQIKRYVIQVNPGRPRLGIDLTLCPKSVLPDARNQKTEFTARIYAFKGGKWVYPGEKRKITFSFKEVSKEKGVCLNYPEKDKINTNPDLFFPDDDDRMNDFDFDEDDTDGDADKACPTMILVADDNPAHSHHYKKATTKNAVTEAKVLVRCEDYGAFGILKAEAADCEFLKPRERDAGCSQELGDNDVKIPRDDNGNNIADSAAQDKNKDGTKALPDKDEDDTPRGNGDKGDGFTNYEEYRGFIVGKVDGPKSHKRTDINKKQLFIHDKNKIGTGFFGRSGLEIIFIPGPEYYGGDSTDGDKAPDAGTQIINFNRDPNVGGDQHGIRLVKENLGGNVLGQAVHARFGWLPKEVNRVRIDVAAHAGMAGNALSASIAHELGHCSNLQHHGQLPSHNHGPTSDPTGGVTSGDVNCVMRYDNYRSIWCHVTGASHCIHKIPSPENPGTTFCDSQDGNGCNASGSDYWGDPCAFTNDASADRGECKNRIKVKDW